jgi:hypothetical protein
MSDGSFGILVSLYLYTSERQCQSADPVDPPTDRGRTAAMSKLAGAAEHRDKLPNQVASGDERRDCPPASRAEKMMEGISPPRPVHQSALFSGAPGRDSCCSNGGWPGGMLNAAAGVHRGLGERGGVASDGAGGRADAACRRADAPLCRLYGVTVRLYVAWPLVAASRHSCRLNGVKRRRARERGTGLQYAISGAGGYTAPTSSRIVVRGRRSRHRSYNGAALPTS